MRQSQPVPALLVVDDTPSIRELLIHTLRSLVPYEIIAVTDATAALAVLAVRPKYHTYQNVALGERQSFAFVTCSRSASAVASSQELHR